MPFGLLYFISDMVYILMYYIVGYRKKVVRENLKNSFPELSDEERAVIEKKFYKHFADFLLESTKSLSISNKAIEERCALINPEEVNKYFDQGKDVIVLCGHYNNWEYYAVGIAQQMKHKTIAAYRPLKNKFFNRKILNSRQRFGMKMLSMREIPRFFAQTPSSTPILSVMVNDQSPGDPKTAYWNTFLNQDTGWMKGAEKLAKKYDQIILFGAIRKKKRGFYEVSFYPISEDITKERDGFVLDKHAEYLEMVIREHPQYWLWSHRRWKHKRPD
jgi:KDO2-lipid IV(A) lauroyltransferase